MKNNPSQREPNDNQEDNSSAIPLNFLDIIKSSSSLPPAINLVPLRQTGIYTNISKEAFELRALAEFSAYMGNFDEAIDCFSRSRSINAEEGNKFAEASDSKSIGDIYSNMISIYIEEKDKEEFDGGLNGNDSGTVFTSSNSKSNDKDFAHAENYLKAMEEYNNSLNVYKAINSIEDQKLVVTSIIKLKESIQLTFKDTILDYLELYKLEQGIPNKEAHRVEQHEVGYSSSKLMGTDNIQQCLAVIIRNPATKKTALAHFDAGNDPQALKQVLDKMAKPQNKLEVRLVGSFITNSQYIFNANQNTQQQIEYIQRCLDGQDRTSLRNINEVLEVLKNYQECRIGLIGADIASKPRPTGIIVNPESGEVTPGSPALDSGDNWIRDGLINIPGLDGDMREIDFDNSNPNGPIRINKDQIGFICSVYKGCENKEKAMETAINKDSCSSNLWKAKFIMGTVALVNDFFIQLKNLRDHSDFNDLAFDLGSINQLYVGNGAGQKNLELKRSGLMFGSQSATAENKNLRIAEKTSLSSPNKKFNLVETLVEANGKAIQEIKNTIEVSLSKQQPKTNNESSIPDPPSKEPDGASPHKVTLLGESHHNHDHKDNVLSLISQIKCGIIKSDTVIHLERKEGGKNLGMSDVKLLASIIKHNEGAKEDNKVKLPESITNSLIYHDSLLYNAALDKGISVMGIEGKSLINNKSIDEKAYNQEREEYMKEQILNTTSKGKNVVFLVGSTHIKSLETALSNKAEGRNLEVQVKLNEAASQRIIKQLSQGDDSHSNASLPRIMSASPSRRRL